MGGARSTGNLRVRGAEADSGRGVLVRASQGSGVMTGRTDQGKLIHLPVTRQQ